MTRTMQLPLDPMPVSDYRADMCLICVQWDKLRLVEVVNNLSEMRSGLPEDHVKEIEAHIRERQEEAFDELINAWDAYFGSNVP